MMMPARALVVVLAAMLLSSCAAGPGLLGTTGQVTGHVMTRACGGAYRDDQTPCRPTPVSGATLTFRLDGSSETMRATTDSTGVYRTDLKPGVYVVDVAIQPPKGAGLPTLRGFAGPKTITVTTGKTLTADFIRTIQLL